MDAWRGGGRGGTGRLEADLVGCSLEWKQREGVEGVLTGTREDREGQN